jgi:hypothetical protein
MCHIIQLSNQVVIFQSCGANPDCVSARTAELKLLESPGVCTNCVETELNSSGKVKILEKVHCALHSHNSSDE